MADLEPFRCASLVYDLHAPRRSTVAECLERWLGLDEERQRCSYLVVEGDLPGVRNTLASTRIASLAALAA